MLNILIPLAGKSLFFDSNEYLYPKPLIELGGKPIIQWVVENYSQISAECRFIFAVNKLDCDKYHLDNVMNLLTDNNCIIVKLDGDTKGALCSSLMAIDHIDNEEPLIVANGDQIICSDLRLALKKIEENEYDASVISFESVHPRWSYVRLDADQFVIETAEKRPISKNAIAGFYYFKAGRDFVVAAMETIRKDSNTDGLYYISSTFNELVLKGKKIGIYKIKNEEYFSFYSPAKIKENENKIVLYQSNCLDWGGRYAACTSK